ncbi:MAG: aspartate carbamoyltransferase [Spirochaetales bacterium]|nr:aspartate carbamoyltransferase [Spirochaetales bacterium]
MNTQNPLRGRTLAVAGDLSVEEQRYLYEKTRALKEAWRTGGDLEPFRVDDPELGVYLMFLEDSTRTKESFRNAACFHNVKLNVFDANTSSFKKSESIVDTVKMLYGYSRRSIFIMRTKTEGVCRALEEQVGDYAQRIGGETPVFINGGDGKHEHPTQEFLDEFTFLEQRGFDDSSIHVALIGDLQHGRTIHSKAEGLKVFRNVVVDLVAPEELALPETYKRKMRENGFEVREWGSIDEYLQSGHVSDTWYFTRLQLERMGDEVKEREDELRRAVTFRPDFLNQLPEGTRFFHPLPRHREKPVVPPFLDSTALNGWDEQSINGFFTRIIELALVAGKLGHDFTGQGPLPKPPSQPFISEVPITRKTTVQDRFKVGIKPVDEGIVIDHIARGHSEQEIWNRVDRIRRILNLNVRSSHGVFHTSDQEFKGIISLPDITEFSPTDLKKLAAVSPGCTLNIIKESSVASKFRLSMPPKIYNFQEISCKNPECITHPSGHQHVAPFFHRDGSEAFACHYCGKVHGYGDIWDL